MKPIDVKWARATFDYDPETGAIIRKADGRNAVRRASTGHAVVYVGGRNIRGARLAWTLHNGESPRLGVVCINGKDMDLRPGNLKLATRSDQNATARLSRSNQSGAKGVWWDPRRQRWRVMVQRGGKNHHVGRFTDFAEACEAYRRASADLHGDFASDGA